MTIDKIVCAGKNYLAHVQEMHAVRPEKPVLFLKPASVLKQADAWGQTLQATFPAAQGEVHHECEIVLRVASGGYRMTIAQAAQALTQVSLGLDMTLRSLQTQLKKEGDPWTTAKVFPDAAIVGPWIAIDKFNDFINAEFTLTIDDVLRQRGRAAEMLTSPVDLIAYISHFFPLCAGDVIFTGTPAGVSSIVSGSKATLSWGDYSYHVAWV
jgi:2-keto-4-pentenoate hydratase/2-oxohepta-3-ene-1,7-dioic acid hydratase in catechol pathway